MEGGKLGSPDGTLFLHSWIGTQSLTNARETLYHGDLERDQDVVYIDVMCDFLLCFYVHNMNIL